MYQICTKTVMDTSDPNIIFDQNGVSNHYYDFHRHLKKKMGWEKYKLSKIW